MSAGRRLGVAAAVVDGVLVAGDVEVAGGEVVAVALPGPGSGLAIPGLLDLQVNGFAGIDLLGADDDDAWHDLGASLLRTGVTAYQPTLITAAPESTAAALRRAERVRRREGLGARLLGVHLEGPFVSAERLGAHPAEHRRDPDHALLRSLLDVGPVSMVTLAPELPRALELIDTLVSRGVVVSAGHSEASAEEAAAAFDRGATFVTHLFNAMPAPEARAPGLAGMGLARPDVALGCIADGVHLADEMLRLILTAAGNRMVLVSDAIAAAGMDDGEWRLGDVAVSVHGRRACRADGTLAGSVGTVLEGVRRLVRLGASIEAAVGAATSTPARLLRRDDVGILRPGARANLVVLDDDLEVRLVLLDGISIDLETA